MPEGVSRRGTKPKLSGKEPGQDRYGKAAAVLFKRENRATPLQTQRLGQPCLVQPMMRDQPLTEPHPGAVALRLECLLELRVRDPALRQEDEPDGYAMTVRGRWMRPGLLAPEKLLDARAGAGRAA